MAGDAELEAAGFRKHHVDARTLNIVHPQDTRQLGPFCRLDVATPLEVPLQPGVYAWVTDGEVRYVGHASVLRQIVNGTRMGRAYNDYTYVPPSKLQQTSSPRVYVNGLLNAAFVRGGRVTWQGPGIVVRCPFWAWRAESECGQDAGGVPGAPTAGQPSPSSQSRTTLHNSAFVVLPAER
jgi:hypothetical protein